MSRKSLSQQAHDPEKAASFIKALHSLTDPRDNRGKRINLAFIVGAVVLAIMSGRSKPSSIHRYIWNRAGWLRKVTKMPGARLISRAHLPRLLGVVPLGELNDIVEAHFGVRLEVNEKDEWVAIDSKTLRGTTHADDKQGERTLLAVTHTKRDILAQRPMSGPKSSEITVTRELLRETGLEKGKVTLDALHMNPTTTRRISRTSRLRLRPSVIVQISLKCFSVRLVSCNIWIESDFLGHSPISSVSIRAQRGLKSPIQDDAELAAIGVICWHVRDDQP